MLMLEHDAKELLASQGVPVPAGVLITEGERPETPPFAAPWFVKAQVPTGGRGKAGGIIRTETDKERVEALARLIGGRLKGHYVQGCRVEQAVVAESEAYLSLSIDSATGKVHVLLSPEGGVDIENTAQGSAVLSVACARNADDIQAQISALAAPLDEPVRGALCDAGAKLSVIFCQFEAVLLEINPLLVRPDGSWVAGDAKLIIDENALVRQPAIVALVERRAAAYPELALKLVEGFDYVELDRDGVIGLVTTGAGLSMQLIDELTDRGCRPFNFCDIRSGNFRGDPARLIKVLRWIAAGPNVGSVLINFFAGITHLGELSRLLLEALDAVPELTAPVTVRLVGNGLEEAQVILQESARGIVVEPDLEAAVAQAVLPLRGRS
jgi:succinyl-CoA synthetase beta subunit